MSIIKETEFIMKKYHIKADKSLGQNFLVDDDAINDIVDSANISKDDLVIEIGPGLGTLTKELLERAGKLPKLRKKQIDSSHPPSFQTKSTTLYPHPTILHYNSNYNETTRR